ncbi:MAG: peptidylprolyl isomerase [Gemmatimonadota bacterium]
MMQFFRKYGAPVFAAAALLLIVWMLWDLSGLGSSGVRQSTDVGKVNGSAIDSRLYQEVVRQSIDQQQRQGGTLDEDEIEQVRNQVWDQFVQARILTTEYDRRHLSASADEIADAIKSQPPQELMKAPEFQTDSQFDMAKYQRWLQSGVAQQYLPQLEEQYRQEILRSKLLRVVTADVYLSDPALWQKFRDEHEQVKIELAAIIPRNAVPDSAVKIAPDEIDKYYAAHRDDFKRPRTAYLSYVGIPRFADASDSVAARARAEAVRKEIADGAPFAEVAKRESADSASATHGGDLGEWKKGAMDPAFDAVAFSLPLHTLSQPVLTNFGYHIIEVSERKGATAKGRHVLIPIEITGTHRDHLDAEADSLESLAANRLDPAALDTVARVLGLKIGKANPAQEGTKVQLGVQVVPEAGIWAFRAKPGETGKVVETPYAMYVFRLDSVQAAGIPPVAQIRPAVEMALRDDKKWAGARLIGKDLQKRVSEGSSLTQAATALHLAHQEFGPFTRINPPFPNPVLVGTAFSLDTGKVSGIIDTKEGLYMIRSLAHIKADSAEFTKKLDELRGKAITAARQERVRNYVTALKDAAKIVDQRSQLYKTDAQAEAAAATQNAGKKGV